MKKYYLFFSLAFIFLGKLHSQTTTTNGTGGGLWSNSGTWAGGVVPTSGKIIVAPGDRLRVNQNRTVDTVTVQYTNTGLNELEVQPGFTLNCSYLKLTPVATGAFVVLDVQGTLNINQGTANRHLEITGNPIYDNLDITMDVPTGGSLSITNNFVFTSQSSSTDLNITTVGSYSGQAFNATFDVADCNFILDINGNFDYTTMNLVFQQDNSDANIRLRSAADVDGTGTTDITTQDQNNAIEILTDAGSNWTTTNAFTTSITGTANSNIIDYDINGICVFNRFLINGSRSNCVISLDIGTTGDFKSNERMRQVFLTASGSSGTSQSITVAAGGKLTVGDYLEIETQNSGVFSIINNGTFSITNDLRNVFRDNTSGIFTNGSTGTFTCKGIEFDYRQNGDLTFNNNGSFTSTTVFHALAQANDVLTLNFNSPATITGNYRQRTLGAGSTVTTHVFNTLTINRLEYDVQAASSTANNVMNINHLNAVLNLNAIDFVTGVGTLTPGTTNNSTVNYKGSTTGDSVIIRSSIDYDNLTISNTAGISLIGHLNSNAIVGDITIASNGQLTLTGSGKITAPADFTNNSVIQDNANNDFTVNGTYTNTGTHGNTGSDYNFKGNFANTGTLTQNIGDTVYFNGPSGTQLITGSTTIRDLVASNNVTISSGSVRLINTISVTGSKVFNSNGKLRLLSDATGTAMVKNITTGNSISGNVIVERYLNEGVGWYMLGSPVAGATIANWDSSIATAGFTGSDVPSGQKTIYTYNEAVRTGGGYSTGYVGATNVTNALTSTLGYFVYVSVAPTTVRLVGTLTQGDGKTTGTMSYMNTGNGAEDGWHLRSNPYASPVTWANVTKNNINNNEGYVRRADDGGNYWAINADGINTLYSGEAVWVQGTSTAPRRLIFDESDKVVANDNYNARQAEPTEFTLPLKMDLTYSGKPSYVDYSVLRFGSDSNSIEFDYVNGEARKMSSSKGTYPNISSWSNADSSDVYYNGLDPADSNFTIPLRVWTYYPTTTTYNYNVKFNGIDAWVKNGHCLVIEDTVANTSTKLDAQNDTYTWSMKANQSLPQLFLHHSMPLSFEGIQDATCFGFNDGTATVNVSGGGSHDFNWVNQNGDTVLSQFGITGSAVSNNLPAGNYTVWVSNNGICGDMAVSFEIGEPAQVIADFNSDFDTIYLNANTTIGFTNSSANASDYFWDFGDGNTSNQASPSHTYVSGGSFNVIMAAIQDDCSDTVEKTIVVVDNIGIDEGTSDDFVKVFRQYGETVVEMNFRSNANVIIDMYDMLGRSVTGTVRLNNVQQRREVLNIPAHISGIHTVVVFDGVERRSFKLY